MTANTYIVEVQEDKETGELILPLPIDALSQLGWSEGTELFWYDNHDGTFVLMDKKNESNKK